MSNPDAAAARETLERNDFHRSAAQPVREARVMNDPTAADVDAVMVVEGARCDEMGGEGRLLTGT